MGKTATAADWRMGAVGVIASVTSRLVAAAKREYWLARIDRMGITDREYFEILAGRTFSSDRAAIRYYLRHEADAVLGLALSPLVEQDWIHQFEAASDASWYAQLLRGSGTFSTSPYFDPDVYRTGAGHAAPPDTLGALRHFLSGAESSTPMPLVAQARRESMTWGECRAAAMGSARRYTSQIHLRRARTSATWDLSAEGEFLNLIADVADSEISDCLVSIVMPTRDRIQSLPAAIRSVEEQTHTNWELIIVDDGSADGTGEFVRSLAARDVRVRLITAIPGRGVSAARNAALGAAAGDVVAFLDSDNAWLPQFLSRSLKGMHAYGSRVVHAGMRLRRDDDVIVYRGMDGTRDDLLYAGNFVDLNSMVVERTLLTDVGGFDESILRWVDYDLVLSLSARALPRYLAFVGVDYDDRTSPDRITGMESPAWEDAVLNKHIVDWGRLEGECAGRAPRSVSVIIPTYADWQLTSSAVRSVLDNSGAVEPEILVIDNGSRRQVSAILEALFGSTSRVRIVRCARNLNFALANNYGLSLSRGAFVVALNNDTEVTADWLAPLIAPLEESSDVLGTQPLLLYPDGSIQTAGTVFLGEGTLPRHFLAGRSIDDLERVSDPTYSAVTAAALCMRAADLVSLRGYDPLYTNGLEDVDLCLRALALRDGAFTVVTASIVYHHEGMTPNRSRAATRNRSLFLARWAGSYPPSDRWRFDELGINADD